MTKDLPTPLVFTEDGSPTLYNPSCREHYHSIHGAVAESLHVFIQSAFIHWIESQGIGCCFCAAKPLRLFELGFGTGLNALATLAEAERLRQRVIYYAIEKYPVKRDIYEQLSFALPNTDQLLIDNYLQIMHQSEWDQPIAITPYFVLHKMEGDVLRKRLPENIDVFYMDAFSPEAQAELWSRELFERFACVANDGAILSTYCAKGEVRRRLIAAGFDLEKLPGPIGKRHILRATQAKKLNQ